MSLQPYLPPELLGSVIDALLPSYRPIAFPAAHIITKTLLSLTLTSRATYVPAMRHLYTSCLHIDSAHCLLPILKALNPQMRHLSRLPPVNVLPSITSLFISLDFTYHMEAVWANELLNAVAPTLRRLVIDFPLRSFRPPEQEDEYGFNFRPELRAALTRLTQLEVFCSVQDELYLDQYDHPENEKEDYIWSLWPKLKVLALYNPDIGTDRFSVGVGKLTKLETLVVTRGDGLESVGISADWAKYIQDGQALDLVLVNIEEQHSGVGRWKLRKGSPEKDSYIHVTEICVPVSYYGDENPIPLCQKWVKRKMIRGKDPRDWE